MKSKIINFLEFSFYPKRTLFNLCFQMVIAILSVGLIIVMQGYLLENVNLKYSYIPDNVIVDESGVETTLGQINEQLAKHQVKYDEVFKDKILKYDYLIKSSGYLRKGNESKNSINYAIGQDFKLLSSLIQGSQVKILHEFNTEGIYISETLFKTFFSNLELDHIYTLEFFPTHFIPNLSVNVPIKGIYGSINKDKSQLDGSVFVPKSFFNSFKNNQTFSQTEYSFEYVTALNEAVNKKDCEMLKLMNTNSVTRVGYIEFEKEHYQDIFTLITYLIVMSAIIMVLSIGFLIINRIKGLYQVIYIKQVYYAKTKNLILELLLSSFFVFAIASVISATIIGVVELIIHQSIGFFIPLDIRFLFYLIGLFSIVTIVSLISSCYYLSYHPK